MLTKRHFAGLSLIAILVLAGCNGETPGVAQAPTATLAPIVSMTPRYTATPVATRTPLPTFTYTPSVTPIPPTPSDTPTPTEVPPQLGVIQSSQRVNVREGPGVNFREITALNPGTRVEILGSSQAQDWLNILMEDGTQGWVSTRLVFQEPTQTPFPTLTPSPDLTALALGSPLPTALLGRGTITPTPPLQVITPTPITALGQPTEASTAETTAEATGETVINLSSFNMTATALVSSITGDATLSALNRATATLPIGEPTSSVPVGGPTGGPIGPTATRLAGAGTAGNITDQQGVDVMANCDNSLIGRPAPANLRAGATVDVYWWWYAKTPELLQDHTENAIYDVRVNGEALNNWRLYGAPVRQQNNDYYQYWYVPFGPLQPGEYKIEFRVSWRAQISDGYAQFGPNTGTPSETGSCTFRVAP